MQPSLRFTFALLCALLCGACGRVGLELVPLDDGGLLPGNGGPGGGNDASGSSGDAATNDGGGIGGDGSLNGDGGLNADAAPEPGSCDLDSDDDGTVDCEDGCPNDPDKLAPGVCGCMIADRDGDGDGLLDCMDTCGGLDDSAYVPDDTCGVGYCQTNNMPSRCVSGVEQMCMPGAPRSGTDTTCDGVDDNCNGTADEGYVRSGPCGQGICRTRSTPSSCNGGVVTACQPGAPIANNDVTADGVDDDCDGQIDEDACVPHTDTFGIGSHSVSPGPCTRLTVKLWGGGGASGDAEGGYWASVTGGQGGPGGFAQGTFTVTSSSNVQLLVGRGGQGCGGAGTNPTTAYNGGTGATSRGGNGSAGADGSVAGGTGAAPSGGGRGGNAFFGGGGGGGGSGPAFAPFGSGGGGGAASVLTIGGTRMVAGGGGGGGGAGANITTAGFSGGGGGSGCGANGATTTSAGGGGGGGGVCQGATTSQRGTGRTPYDAAGELSGGAAAGGNSNTDCQAGGDGFAIVSYAP